RSPDFLDERLGSRRDVVASEDAEEPGHEVALRVVRAEILHACALLRPSSPVRAGVLRRCGK
ncbi:MAG TPA: hypothetical protein VKE94_13340, partial [Gemmataceae bacterium]|nr:hypothetical protein [Gemmataceae bacterium]